MSWVTAARCDLTALQQQLKDTTDPDERARLSVEIEELRSLINRTICRDQENVGWW